MAAFVPNIFLRNPGEGFPGRLRFSLPYEGIKLWDLLACGVLFLPWSFSFGLLSNLLVESRCAGQVYVRRFMFVCTVNARCLNEEKMQDG